MGSKQTTEVHVYFKVTLLDYVRNIFKPKAKRKRRSVSFTNFTAYRLTDTFLRMEWDGVKYYYPIQQIQRIKFS